MMTWMVDWMGEDNLSYCRVVLLCHNYERVKYNIVIVLRILYLLMSARVLVLGFWSLGFWSLDFYIKSESLFIVIRSFVRSYWIDIFVRIL